MKEKKQISFLEPISISEAPCYVGKEGSRAPRGEQGKLERDAG
jgi:hypothetical protein